MTLAVMTRLVAIAGAILTAAAASAQTSVAVAIGASTQAEGAGDQPYLGPPFGGTSRAIVAMVDRAPARNIALGGEVSLAAAISGTQSQRAPGGINSFVSDHRDAVFSGTFKAGTPFDAPVRAAFVLGAGVAQRHTARAGIFNPEFGRVSAPFAETLTDWVPAITVGADVSASVSRHVGLLGVARVHQLKDDDRLPDGVVERGVSSTIVRLGGGVQLRF